MPRFTLSSIYVPIIALTISGCSNNEPKKMITNAEYSENSASTVPTSNQIQPVAATKTIDNQPFFVPLSPESDELKNISPLSRAAILEMYMRANNYKSQIGSRHCSKNKLSTNECKELKEKFTLTDCYIFSRGVLVKAFTAIGKVDLASGISKYREDGGDVAKYLVERAGWSSWFWNPDVKHPHDGNIDKHYYFARQAANSRKHYYNEQRGERFIPINYYLVNFNPVPQKDYPGKIVGEYEETKLDVSAVDYIRSRPFCYGITEGSLHTFLLSYGKVFEVHWDKLGSASADPYKGPDPSQLYEVSDFFDDFSNRLKSGWAGGVIVCAPEAGDPPASAATYKSG